MQVTPSVLVVYDALQRSLKLTKRLFSKAAPSHPDLHTHWATEVGPPSPRTLNLASQLAKVIQSYADGISDALSARPLRSQDYRWGRAPTSPPPTPPLPPQRPLPLRRP